MRAKVVAGCTLTAGHLCHGTPRHCRPTMTMGPGTEALLQVSLLDPVQYPGAIKAFAKEVCRNDLLNFGRLHFFFPDSRLSLDLNTDKTLKVGLLSPFARAHPGLVHRMQRCMQAGLVQLSVLQQAAH